MIYRKGLFIIPKYWGLKRSTIVMKLLFYCSHSPMDIAIFILLICVLFGVVRSHDLPFGTTDNLFKFRLG